jgi:hypothetical protein
MESVDGFNPHRQQLSSKTKNECNSWRRAVDLKADIKYMRLLVAIIPCSGVEPPIAFKIPIFKGGRWLHSGAIHNTSGYYGEILACLV